MTKPDLLAAVKADWEMSMEGLIYKSLLPPDLKLPLNKLRPFDD